MPEKKTKKHNNEIKQNKGKNNNCQQQIKQAQKTTRIKIKTKDKHQINKYNHFKQLITTIEITNDNINAKNKNNTNVDKNK